MYGKQNKKMNTDTIITELQSLIKESREEILPTKWISENVIGSPYRVSFDKYLGWFTKAFSFLKLFLPEDNVFLSQFSECNENLYALAEASLKILENLIEYIEKGFIVPGQSRSVDTEVALKTIFSRFHKVARQLRSRHENRKTLDISDEYDVQDLLHALLRLFFDDVRTEEWTPSYAGKSARMDFLLKNECIVIEVKKTRQGLTDKEVGDQLIIDVDRYKVHPDCKKLICFVYDPEGRIGNPEGIMRDLNKQHEGFVEVIIEPDM